MADGTITPQEYMDKLEHFIRVRTDQVLNLRNQTALRSCYDQAALFYKKRSRSDMDTITIAELYTLDETIAKDIFQGKTYPWEVLPLLENLFWSWGKPFQKKSMRREGKMCGLPEMPGWQPTASINGPAIIRKRGGGAPVRFYPRKCYCG